MTDAPRVFYTPRRVIVRALLAAGAAAALHRQRDDDAPAEGVILPFRPKDADDGRD